MDLEMTEKQPQPKPNDTDSRKQMTSKCLIGLLFHDPHWVMQ